MNLASILSALTTLTKGLWALVLFVLGAMATVLIFGYQAAAGFLTFLAQTWIIQTVVAAWVAFQLQEISQANGRKRERLQAAYDRKVVAAKGLYALIEKRIYASRRYASVIQSEQEKIPDERERYRTAVTEWNEQAQLHQVTLLLEFDSYFGLMVDNIYNPEFSKIDALLRKQRLLVSDGKSPDRPTASEVRKILGNLNRISLDVFREMLKEAKSDRNIMDEKVEISEVNIDHLSYGRLFKALFQPNA